MSLPRPGLRSRFVMACLLMVTISTAGYYIAVSQALEYFESAVLEINLQSQLNAFASQFSADPATPVPRTENLKTYVQSAGEDASRIPDSLRGLTPGTYDEIHIAGHEVMVAHEIVNGARLFLVLDLEPLEAMEARFVRLAWLCALGSWLAAVLLALWLARRVLLPVTRLAEAVGNTEPGQQTQKLSPDFDDADVGIIAQAFDRFMERLDAFVSREQAFTEEASHELRTPLSIIDSSAQLLAEDASLSQATRGRVMRIQRATAQMRMQIEALLFLAREDGGHSSESIALDQMVRDIAEGVREQLKLRPVELRIDTEPTNVRAPHGMAACVIGNLLNNAAHFTEKGLVEVHVRPGALHVQDTGIGISPESLERIFDRNFRGAQSRGLGLGLYLVKRICDRLGWSVVVRSAEGSGTRFEIHFPVPE